MKASRSSPSKRLHKGAQARARDPAIDRVFAFQHLQIFGLPDVERGRMRFQECRNRLSAARAGSRAPEQVFRASADRPPSRASGHGWARRNSPAPERRRRRPAFTKRHQPGKQRRLIRQPLEGGVGEDHVIGRGRGPAREIGQTPGRGHAAGARLLPACRRNCPGPPAGPAASARPEAPVELPGPQPRSITRAGCWAGTRASRSAAGRVR